MNAAQISLPIRLPTNVDVGSAPTYIEKMLFLEPPSTVLKTLASMDWAFETDDTGFLAHDIHPYPAKFIPQIPGHLIAALSARGELVMDPFGGSGTTALEAIRLGRRALSIDVNPLSELIGRAKTMSVTEAVARELHGFQAALSSELQSVPSTDMLLRLYGKHAPTIPNREKWFADEAFSELCLIKARINDLDDEGARDVALVALSKIALKASFQDSETRYKSVVRHILPGETLRRYLRELSKVMFCVEQNQEASTYGVCSFMCGDVRALSSSKVADASVDLITTSPPYGNATDYHLYHRFRLMWLGFDPVELGRVEIGSHLKHQREASGFESYYADLIRSVETMARVLRSGRYATLVLGNAVYSGVKYEPAERLRDDSQRLDFDACDIIERPLHNVRRSFAQAGRRATTEKIVIMRRSSRNRTYVLMPPPYKLWPYERELRLAEASRGGISMENVDPEKSITIEATAAEALRHRDLAFTHGCLEDGAFRPTWQAILENGTASTPAARKDPKYVTHGLHAYKGKFYPQLAKSLLNLARLDEGALVLDPFCGSGTTLLEAHLNGYKAIGLDLNPLAAKIAKAKTEILRTPPDVVVEAMEALVSSISISTGRLPQRPCEFPEDCKGEIARWFAPPVAQKIDWILRCIRKNSAGSLRDFFEVVLSGIIREVSQQEPTDLRIRYRKNAIEDADVIGLFRENLGTQFARIEKFWKVRGWAPHRFHDVHAMQGDNRQRSTFDTAGIKEGSVDLVLTSPPYGTALPYIDTDRLSLLTIMGISNSARRPIENSLIGSREIGVVERRRIEGISDDPRMPSTCSRVLNELAERIARDSNAGFRKCNMPALMKRYILDMGAVFENLDFACKAGGEVMIVVGDNRMDIGGVPFVIPTTRMVAEMGAHHGFSEAGRIDISVTTENLLHQKNAITENVILRLRRSLATTSRQAYKAVRRSRPIA